MDGTRITVEFILDHLSTGRSEAELVAKHPELSLEAIHAARQFMLQAVKRNDINVIRFKVRHVLVAIQPDKLARAIDHAFWDVRLGNGPSLRQMEIMDNHGRDDNGNEISGAEFNRLRQIDEVNDWRAITLSDLEDFPYLAYADSEAFRFYIPALMIRDLGAQSFSENTIYRLMPRRRDTSSRDYDLAQYSLLNEQQRHVIARFLNRMSKMRNEESRFYLRDTEKALNNYWGQFLRLKDKQ